MKKFHSKKEKKMKDLKYKLLDPSMPTPEFKTAGSACFDLHVAEDVELLPGRGVLISTGLAFEPPEGYHIEIYMRSSMCRRGITGPTGIVDNDYRGEVKVQAMNLSDTALTICKYDRIAQARLVKDVPTTLVPVAELSKTERGEKGFGSTGR